MDNVATQAALGSQDLLNCSDKLEASLTVMHGSAYDPSRKAVRCMRRLAENRSLDGEERQYLEALITQLQRFANTVSNPARTRMLEAAKKLASILAE